MASSGRLPSEITDLLTSTILVSVGDPASTLYGKRRAGTTKRRVKCMVQAATYAGRSSGETSVTYTYDIYCDDINIVESDVVELPDGTTPAIASIDSYADEVGPLYQVVHC